MQKIFDFAVFGGGIIGASIFNKLCKMGKNCVLIELNDIASGATKANSAIIHAGFDAKPNTLKAKFNVEGSKMYPHICSRLGVPYKQIGAYVLGSDLSIVKELYNRGIENGLNKNDLQILTNKDLNKRLPNLNPNITCALFAKNSAITNPYLLNIALAEEGVINGGTCLTFFKTTNITHNGQHYIINGNNTQICAKKIINACGYGYNDIAKLLKTETYNITLTRGEYFVLDHSEQNIVSSTLFPLPSKLGKGVLVTPTVDGNILVGPNATFCEFSTKTTIVGLNDIKQKSASLINNINFKKSIRQFAGLRTVCGDDFIIEQSKKDKNVINIAGICSPGLSSAPAIAEYVVKLLGINNKEIKNKKLEPYFLAKDLTDEQFNSLVKKDPHYGKIICKCEMITEGDIVFALHRPIPALTVDAVKRRVRAGMGRCQGGFCMDKVAKIIAREYNMPLCNVQKEFPNSNIFVGNIKEAQHD